MREEPNHSEQSMPIQLVCSSKGKAREADAVVDLIAAHRRAISELECLGKRLMHAEEAEAQLIGPRLFGERNGYSTAGSDGAGVRCWRAENEGRIFRAAHLPSDKAGKRMAALENKGIQPD